jgi:hypothetical protein
VAPADDLALARAHLRVRMHPRAEHLGAGLMRQPKKVRNAGVLIAQLTGWTFFRNDATKLMANLLLNAWWNDLRASTEARFLR